MLPSVHPICYSFIEVGGPHNSLYPGVQHVVSDSIAHACESEADTPVLQLLDET